MENVLDIDKRPYDPAHPVVCMDETPGQLIGEVREPMTAAPGRVVRQDDEYQRLGVCNVFMACEPLAGRRMTKVTAQKTKLDWAQFLDDIAQQHQQAERITSVMDNLNTHRRHGTRHLNHNGPKHCGTGSSLSTHPNTAVGSIWPRSS
jgi:hypothetical protein